MRLHKLSSMILAAAAVLSAVTTQASVALFDSATDTIQVGGHTILGTAATYEARVLFTSQYDSFGDIYDEWSYGLEDKQLSVSSHMVRAYSGPIHYEGDNTGYIVANCSMSLGTWHHVAYVYDGSKESIYVDGQIEAERASSGNIGNGEQYLPQIGAIMRPNLVSNFQGYLDTLRISDVARYSRDSFSPPSGKLASDSQTALLYNFDETPGSTTITDLSGHGLNGTLGVGFSGATSPEFVTNPVPEPSTLVLLSVGAIGFLAWAWRRQWKLHKLSSMVLAAVLGLAGEGAWLYATPVNPEGHRKAFEEAKKDAEVVAEVRVLSVVCTGEYKTIIEDHKVHSVTLQIALQVLEIEKGLVKRNEIVVVSRQVALPVGPGPGSYGYMAALRQFPFTPGVKGNVALRWDKEARRYVGVAGWVPEPNNAEIPKEVGKSISVKDLP